ncbi:UNVERIFIED_CONTAM: hypothetical protein FKN15_034859 [Acipenser sinensis]
MFEKPGDPMCPVQSLVKYMSKMPQHPPCFYLQPKPFSPENAATQPVWYTCKPQGKNTIGNLMATLSEKAMLSKRYTNHCIRATTVQLPSDADLKTREIMSVTGHRNEGSSRSYWKANQQQKDTIGPQFCHQLDPNTLHQNQPVKLPTLFQFFLHQPIPASNNKLQV